MTDTPNPNLPPLSDGTALADIPANAPQRALRLHRELARVWANDRGLWGQVTAVSHTTLGLRFMATAFVFFAIGGILSMLIRAQLATPQGAFLDTELYNQIFTMHGSIMMFLFAIPMLEGLGIWLLPKLLGTRDMAFPRLTALGYWCYLFGGLIMLTALLFGVAPRDGWFMYTPLSDATHSPGINADVWLLGVTFVEISAIAAAVEITVTILRQRAPGMKLTEMPLFAWYMLGTSAMMLVGFPPLIAGSVLLEVERAFDWPFFDVARGGDPLLWQHLFWLFGHPEVYIIFLPAAGAMSTIIPVMCRTPILGYGAIAAAILGLVFLSFGLWVHHMFTVGIPHMALAFFSAASVLVAVPTAVQVFAWIGTMWKGRPELHLPMLHILGFFLTFVMGGLTGVMLAIVPFNWQAHDTAFVTAHLHYVLIGGFVFPMMAAATYWMPLITGKARVNGLGEAAFWVILLGFHGTFFIMHLTGLLGMPRRIDVYPENPEWMALNLTSSIFGFVLTIGFAMFALDLILQASLGKRARRDPWRAPTLDWAMPVPSPNYNFASLPLVRHQGGPARDVIQALARGIGALAGAPRGRREVLVTSAGTARPCHVAVLPGNTALPLVLAGSIAVFVLLMLASLYALAAVALLPVAVLVWLWVRGMAPLGDLRAVTIAPGTTVPVHHRATRPTLAQSGVHALLVADGALFASLLFGVGFLSVVTQGPPPPPALAQNSSVALGLAGIAGALALGAGAARLLTMGRAGRWASWAGLVCNLVALVVLAWLVTQLDDPRAHARDALRAAMAGYVGLHVVVAGAMAAFTADQFRRGEISPHTGVGAIPAWASWQAFTAITAIITAAVFVVQAGVA
ncbi:cytochrome c oxidase subunit I [Roseinatronobacter sp. S2]|uniref:cytochrome c oxidase subunit I n=1 Tax=Roseinatronobacter sp. S2 TaxID=3035471 RepID=UPI0024106779|nr:cytochrome c oxidase subunit I [Roseinatronobacter sp. S2]WFE74317.1 cytochrome c oxidase subunit I [Roseinatronobacter sp. S2]